MQFGTLFRWCECIVFLFCFALIMSIGLTMPPGTVNCIGPTMPPSVDCIGPTMPPSSVNLKRGRDTLDDDHNNNDGYNTLDHDAKRRRLNTDDTMQAAPEPGKSLSFLEKARTGKKSNETYLFSSYV